MDPGCVDANMDKTPLKTIYVVQTKSLNVLSKGHAGCIWNTLRQIQDYTHKVNANGG